MYKKIMEKIANKEFSRVELLKIRDNAEKKASSGDLEAAEIITLINNTAVPKLEREYVFLGFCPAADYENRQDEDWKERGICNFEFIQSKHQLERFCEIMPGDTIVLKKREAFGRTMRLYGYGTVKSVGSRNKDNIPYCVMEWSKQEEILEMPLMGCNSTVNVRSLKIVEKTFHPDFWKWLGSEQPTLD